jgi:hypothetical protein
VGHVLPEAPPCLSLPLMQQQPLLSPGRQDGEEEPEQSWTCAWHRHTPGVLLRPKSQTTGICRNIIVTSTPCPGVS